MTAETEQKARTLAEVIRAAGLSPLERVYNSESTTKSAARTMEGRTHYFDADTLRYFGASVSRLHVSLGVALVCLERVAADSSLTRKGYRVVVHDLTGYCLAHGEHGVPSRDIDALEFSKARADKEFASVCALVDAAARGILVDALQREAKRHARAMNDARSALRMLPRSRKVAP